MSYPLTRVPRRPSYQIKHYQGFQRRLVKRQMGQFPNHCSDDFLQSSRMTIRTYTAPRSDSYRACLKNRSSPWCNPGVLSAQTFVVSDKHSSIQKTICQVRCLAFPILFIYSALQCFTLCGITIFAEVAFDKHLSVVTRGWHHEHFMRVSQPP